MRVFLLCVLALLASGCATKSNYRLYSGDPLPKEQEVLVTSAADPAMAQRLDAIFAAFSGTPKLLQADEKFSISSESGMNSTLDSSFELRMKPGKHKLVVIPSINAVRRTGVSITFNGVAGHEYYLGEYATVPTGSKSAKRSGQAFRWQPVFVDVTANKILYPFNPQKLTVGAQ